MLIATLLGQPFHLTLDDIAKLTDRQIVDLYFHKRDKHGVVEPEGYLPDSTPMQEDLSMMTLGKALGIPSDKLKELKRRADERRTSKVDGGGTTG